MTRPGLTANLHAANKYKGCDMCRACRYLSDKETLRETRQARDRVPVPVWVQRMLSRASVLRELAIEF